MWLLCACGVRRLYDLMRVCLYFIAFAFVFLLRLSFVLFLVLLLLCLPFFLSSLLLLLSLFLLSSACPLGYLASDLGLVLSLCGLLLFPFPLRMYGQKKGRAVLVRPRFVGCGLLYLVTALYSSYSSGVNPFIS